MNETALKKGIACLRIGLALYILWMMLPNLDRSYLDRLPEQLDAFTQANPLGWYCWIIHTIAYPQVQNLGTIISVGAALCGAALLIGFLTRACLIAIGVFLLNLALLSWHMGTFNQGFCLLFAMVCASLYLADAGRAYGIDGWIFQATPAKSSKTVSINHKKQKKALETINKMLKTNHSKKEKERDLELV